MARLIAFFVGQSVSTYLYAALAAALLAGGAAWRLHDVHHQRDIGRNEVQQQWDAAVSQGREQALILAEANAKETKRRLERQQELQNVHDQELARARADAAAADVAAGRLSRQLAAYVAAARRASGNPAPAGDSTAGGDPIGVLADLFGRADRRAGELAKAADDARAAGLQCERSYDALTR